jgi:hypothetical protein
MLGGFAMKTKRYGVFAIALLASVSFQARADTFVYNLHNSLEATNGGPSLVSYGGTIGPNGYTFGVQQGLSLSGTGIFDVYNRNGRLEFFAGCCSGPGGTGGSSAGAVFASGQLADFPVTRSTAELFSAYVNAGLIAASCTMLAIGRWRRRRQLVAWSSS